MHASITTVHLQPDKIAEATALYQNNVVPFVKTQHGFQGMYLLTDPSGTGQSISLWESEADGQAYEANGVYREQVSKFAAFFSAPPSLATYDVAVKA
ncbi:MAG TPA: antibiotic biosynthesis monooxygenase [Ktedonobacterales bacterium]|nr:antibiotic biosynthesis monooxygenase [Ktedonobacterales bacterium]